MQEKGCFSLHCCMPQWKWGLNVFEICVLKRNMTFLIYSIYIWSLFYVIICQSLMLHNIFENRKSFQFWNLRQHVSLPLFSKARSSDSSLCSTTLFCFDIVKKHLKGNLWRYEIVYQFCEKKQYLKI